MRWPGGRGGCGAGVRPEATSSRAPTRSTPERQAFTIFPRYHQLQAVRTLVLRASLSGRGILLKPAFEIADHLAAGALVPVCEDNPPLPVSLACVYPHKRLQDPKSRLFIDFTVAGGRLVDQMVWNDMAEVLGAKLGR